MTGMTLAQWKRAADQLRRLGHEAHAQAIEAYVKTKPADRPAQLHLCSNPNVRRCNGGRG